MFENSNKTLVQEKDFKYLIYKDKYVVRHKYGKQYDLADGETHGDSSLPYYRVYDMNGIRDCKWENWDDQTLYEKDKYDDAFKAWVQKQTGSSPRPKKVKKQAVLPDGNIYDLYKSGKKWYVQREVRGTKRLVLVHPK